MAKYNPTITRNQCQLIANLAVSGSRSDVADAIAELIAKIPADKTGKGTWHHYLVRLENWLRNGGKLPHSIFAVGNSKLPFVSFSVLPGVTCPGAGDCLKWCYSFRAWRYPAAFCRQVQNTILMQDERSAIVNAFRACVAKHARKQRKLPQDDRQKLRIRLYVDGDFSSTTDIDFWFRLLNTTPGVLAYGYSKSWQLIRDYVEAGGVLPGNYKLNLSAGSIHDNDAELKTWLKTLSIFRGEFVGVELSGDYGKGFARFKNPGLHKEVRSLLKEQYPGQPTFSCPGQCGTCTKSEHACGSERFVNVVIGIGIH